MLINESFGLLKRLIGLLGHLFGGSNNQIKMP
jgi:hypothetical protein